jgi:hypothetical protein
LVNKSITERAKGSRGYRKKKLWPSFADGMLLLKPLYSR